MERYNRNRLGSYGLGYSDSDITGYKVLGVLGGFATGVGLVALGVWLAPFTIPTAIIYGGAIALGLVGAGAGFQSAAGEVPSGMKKGEKTHNQGDPLLLDLNGDGIKTTGVQGRVFFDHNNNGFAEVSNWVDANDGMLVLDKNSNRLIDNGTEIFGDNTVLSNGQKATDGYAALADLDSNNDGVINAKDANFSKLQVLKGDGTILTLSQAGITGFNLAHTDTNVIDDNGNTQTALGSFIKTDGTTGQMGDYNLYTDTAISNPLKDVAISSEISALPDIVASGNVYNLKQAMALDTTGQLKSLVKTFIASTNVDQQNSLIDQILQKWSGVNPATVSVNGMGDPVHIAIVEQFEGRAFQNNPDAYVGIIPAAYISQEYYGLAEGVYSSLMAQTQLKKYFNAVVSTKNQAAQTYSFDITKVTQMLQTLAQSNRPQAIQNAASFVRSLNGLGWIWNSDFSKFFSSLATLGSDFTTAIDNAGRVVINGTSAADSLASTSNPNSQYDARSVVLNGNAGNDDLVGTFGADILTGGTGNDTLEGKLGNDFYRFNRGDGQDTIIEGQTTVFPDEDGGFDVLSFGSGIAASDLTFKETATQDLIIQIKGTTDQVTITGEFDAYKVANHVEGVVLADGTQYTYDQLYALSKNPANQVLNGTTGNDSLTGSDELFLKISGGLGNDTLNAGRGQDTLDGGDGNDVLNGSTGNDSILGGAGNDTLYGYEGNDTIDGGIGNDFLSGGNGSDSLVGNTGSDQLNGDAGADTLDGGAGNDTLYGNEGNDTYLFAKGGGQDTVYESSSTNDTADTLKLVGLNQANVTFAGDSNDLIVKVNGTTDQITISNELSASDPNSWVENFLFADGTSLTRAQVLTRLQSSGTSANEYLYGSDFGESMFGAAGNDQIYAYAGNDTIDGGDGDDYVSADVGNDSAIGGTGNDTLNGEAGADTLDGGTGNDTLYGNEGNDTYLFAKGGGRDIVYESSSTNDTADTLKLAGLNQTNVTFTGDSNDLIVKVIGTTDQITISNELAISDPNSWVENFLFTDGTSLTRAQVLARLQTIGTSANDYLYGSDFGESMFGAAGNDQIYAYAGNDIIDGGDGNDYVSADVGNDSAIGGTGNDTLNGEAGADTLDGGAGNDTLYGNEGNDTYLFAKGGGQDTIYESSSTNDTADTLKLVGLTQANVTFTGDSNDLIVKVIGTTDQITISNELAVNDPNSWVENFLFADGTSLTRAQMLTKLQTLGTTADDYLYGSDFGESMFGAAGNDQIYAYAGNDTIDGGAGNDYMDGGLGNDLYVVDSTGDSISEDVNGGIDTVQSSITYTLGDNVENLTLTGTTAINGIGNALNNLITGNAANNVLTGGDGNDTLNGAAGNDRLVGGNGNDVYYVDATGDVVVEATSQGTDTVIASVTYTLAANVENLTLNGTAALNGTGNTLNNVLTGNSGNNTLSGLAGDDTLNGGAGVDTLIGGIGNDVYVIDTTTDTITENANEGTDTVQSSVTYALGANLENLTLTGTATLNGTGNALTNVLTGNTTANLLDGGAGNDTLYGGTGNDTLKGGIGNDVYQFHLGDGQDVIQESDSTAGNLDIISFDSSIAKAKVAFFKTGNDLQIGYVGTTDKITVQNQAVATGTVEKFTLSDGSFLTTADVNNVIASMSSYASAHGIAMTSLTTVENNANLMAIANAAWHK